MKEFNFSELSAQELWQIKERIDKEIQSRTRAERNEKMNKIMNYIKDYINTYGDLKIENEYSDDDGIWIKQVDTWELFPDNNLIITK